MIGDSRMKLYKRFLFNLLFPFIFLSGCVILHALSQRNDNPFYHSPHEIALTFLVRPLFWLSLGWSLGQLIIFFRLPQIARLILTIFSLVFLSVYVLSSIYMFTAQETHQIIRIFVIWCAQYRGIFLLPGMFATTMLHK